MQGSPMCGTKMQITNSKPTSSPRARRKPKWKLKFHHQALPQEYLSHYETWQHAPPHSSAPVASITQTLCPPLVPELDLLSPSASPTPPPPRRSPLSSSPPVLKPRPFPPAPLAPPAPPSPPSSVRLTDLPYMGEMILDNARPRRGRKPKKLDICHLIYKNYGTTVVDEPLNLCVRDFATPTTNRLHATSSPASNTMGTTILHHNTHSSSDNQVSMCKFKFTSGPKPTLLEKKLLTSTHHLGRPHKPPPQPSRQKPLDLLTQQQLLGKLLVNEQAKLVTRNSARDGAPSTGRPDFNSIRSDFNFNRFDFGGADFNRTDLAAFSPLDFNRFAGRSVDLRDPILSSLMRATSSDLEMRATSSDVEMREEDRESDETDVPDYHSALGYAFALPHENLLPRESMSPHESLLSRESLSPHDTLSLRESMSPFDRLREQTSPSLSLRASPNDRLLPRDPMSPHESLARTCSPFPAECDSRFACDSSSGPVTHNRRKSRKSQAREKLEKTFKEKGFLIQTQQLESAEGATYCKFRQLRKFTRYLFRSWKPHLPGEVVDETGNME